MAKTIKFNLICDGYPARTIEDLQNRFSVEDLLDYFENGLLVKWLDVRGYNEELQNVRMIRDRDPLRIIENLIKIFDIEEDESKIRETVAYLKMMKEREKAAASYQKGKEDENSILRDYHRRYTNLISGLLSAKDDVSAIKSHIRELVTNYPEILEMVHMNLFYMLYDKELWLTIMYLLADKKAKEYFIPTADELLQASSSQQYKAKKDIFNIICKGIRSDEFEAAMGNHLKTAGGCTYQTWRNIEPSGKNFMIIRMQTSEHVRSAGKKSENLDYYDISNKFIVLDGIDYVGTNAADILYYMEI